MLQGGCGGRDTGCGRPRGAARRRHRPSRHQGCVRASNILIRENKAVLIADFGLACHTGGKSGKPSGLAGTHRPCEASQDWEYHAILPMNVLAFYDDKLIVRLPHPLPPPAFMVLTLLKILFGKLFRILH